MISPWGTVISSHTSSYPHPIRHLSIVFLHSGLKLEYLMMWRLELFVLDIYRELYRERECKKKVN